MESYVKEQFKTNWPSPLVILISSDILGNKKNTITVIIQLCNNMLMTELHLCPVQSGKYPGTCCLEPEFHDSQETQRGGRKSLLEAVPGPGFPFLVFKHVKFLKASGREFRDKFVHK